MREKYFRLENCLCKIKDKVLVSKFHLRDFFLIITKEKFKHCLIFILNGKQFVKVDQKIFVSTAVKLEHFAEMHYVFIRSTKIL